MWYKSEIWHLGIFLPEPIQHRGTIALWRDSQHSISTSASLLWSHRVVDLAFYHKATNEIFISPTPTTVDRAPENRTVDASPQKKIKNSTSRRQSGRPDLRLQQKRETKKT